MPQHDTPAGMMLTLHEAEVDRRMRDEKAVAHEYKSNGIDYVRRTTWVNREAMHDITRELFRIWNDHLAYPHGKADPSVWFDLRGPHRF